jgi:uncharacterized protein (DUF1501 family)
VNRPRSPLTGPPTLPSGDTGDAGDAGDGPGNVAGESGLSRRRFLALAGGVGGVGALAAAFGPRSWDVLFGGSRDTRGALDPGGRRLVLVTLNGGNDGLNTVVPVGDPHYASARGALGLDPATVHTMGDGYGLHPALPGMARLWKDGRLAVVHGVGFAEPNYSHFESMDIWQSGNTGNTGSTGWLGRWLDATHASPLRAVGIGPTTPLALTGAQIQGATLPTGTLRLPGTAHEEALVSALSATTRGEALLAAGAARSTADLLTVHRELDGILVRAAGNDILHLHPGGTDPSGISALASGGGSVSGLGALSTQLSMVANLILAGAPTEAYCVELSGFDTHSAQAATQADLLGQVDTAVTAFVDAVGRDPRGKETVVVVYSEFGRRVTGNASAGSDHGWANVVFVAGAPVRGGWYGEPSSLTRLSDGNLIYTTDFRSVYATLLDRVLGIDPWSVLAGRPKSLGFL